MLQLIGALMLITGSLLIGTNKATFGQKLVWKVLPLIVGVLNLVAVAKPYL